MNRTRYAWRPGAHVALDAQKAGEELARIETRSNGHLTPEGVVARAKDEKNVLHSHFTWDDGEAAHKWRLGEASHLIRAITVDVSTSNLEEKPVRAFLNVEREGGERAYVSTAHAMSDAELRKQILAKAFRELLAWKERYRELEELAKLFTRIDKTVKEVRPDL